MKKLLLCCCLVLWLSLIACGGNGVAASSAPPNASATANCCPAIPTVIRALQFYTVAGGSLFNGVSVTGVFSSSALLCDVQDARLGCAYIENLRLVATDGTLLNGWGTIVGSNVLLHLSIGGSLETIYTNDPTTMPPRLTPPVQLTAKDSQGNTLVLIGNAA